MRGFQFSIGHSLITYRDYNYYILPCSKLKAQYSKLILILWFSCNVNARYLAHALLPECSFSSACVTLSLSVEV